MPKICKNFGLFLQIYCCILLYSSCDIRNQQDDCEDVDWEVEYANESPSLSPVFKTRETTVFQALGPEATGITFLNDVKETFSLNHFTDPYCFGSAVAIGDLDNDGRSDVLFKGSHKLLEIYRNLGDMRFEKIQTKGISHEKAAGGITLVDVNADGLLDVYLPRATPSPKNLLYINQGDFVFKESGEEYGLADTSYSFSSAFFDFDKDGDLDMYLLNHCTDYNDIFRFNLFNKIASGENSSDKFYVNNGNNTFTESSVVYGINNHSYGLGVSVADLNQDGLSDVLVSNDYLFPDQIFLNRGGTKFSDELKNRTNRTSVFGMGTDIADMNNDGFLDFFIAEMSWTSNLDRNTLTSVSRSRSVMEQIHKSGYHYQTSHNVFQVSNGDGTFSELSNLSGVAESNWSWSPLLADFDNDGLRDIFVSTGFFHSISNDNHTWEWSVKESLRQGNRHKFCSILKEHRADLKHLYYPNVIYQNLGNLTFKNKSKEWGMDFPTQSWGAAYADLDDDGDLDIVVSNIGQPSFIYENRSGGNYLRVRLQFSKSNKDGLGSTVRLITKSGEKITVVHPVKGFTSQSETTVHFGLGTDTVIKSLEVLWPNGLVSVHKVNGYNETMQIDYSSSSASSQPFYKPSRQNVFQVSTDFDHIINQEKDYNDFDKNYSLIKKLSRQGPCIAIGDINGDGLDDCFFGGSSGQPAFMAVQDKDGGLNRITSEALDLDKHFEDASALIIDHDGDGDNDLVVSSSASEIGTHAFNSSVSDGLLRVYVNDGVGNFRRNIKACPRIDFGLSGLSAQDFDRDGDLDIFVGNEVDLEKYPLLFSSAKVLVNDNGTFKDFTEILFPEMAIGHRHISSAVWTDYDNDGDYDLLGVGELGGISLFQNVGETFTLQQDESLLSAKGLWNSIIGADFDADGDIDYVAGNWGRNSFLEASIGEPLTVYYGDFDRDKTEESIITQFIEGKEHPIIPFDVFSKILPSYQKLETYSDYGRSAFHELFSEDILQKIGAYPVTQLNSVFIENKGAEGFEIRDLPIEAQVSTIYGILVDDFNQDGCPDILCHGNFYGTDPTMDRMSESTGLLLVNDREGWFNPSRSIKSGFWSRKEGRGLVCLNRVDKNPIIIGSNQNDTVTCHKFTDDKLSWFVPNPATKHIIVDNGEGIRYTREFYIGQGYRSQQSNGILIGNSDAVIEEYDIHGNMIAKSSVN